MKDERRLRVELGPTAGTDAVTLAWGNATEWKAELRDEALERHLALPLSERLRRALLMLQLARGS
jgi:hypothetical protein